MGHVPPRPLREERSRAHLPRRQHRRDRAPHEDLNTELAKWGERVAADFLRRRGAEVVARNLRVGRGEIDLVVRFGDRLVAVEVKTVGPLATAATAVDRIDEAKLRQVRALASRWGSGQRRRVRVDFVGVRAGRSGVTINWRTAVA